MRGGIVILKRELAIIVAFVALFLTALIHSLFFEVKVPQKFVIEKSVKLAMSSEEELSEDFTEETEVKVIKEHSAQAPKKQVVTSRSGIDTPRETKSIYYEEINLSLTEIIERIVEAEAGGSDYNGRLAVANVVLNRVQSSRFPNTLKEVIFAPKQFSPISDGRYYTIKVSETTKKVVADALNGSRIIGEDALYFCTPTAPGKGWFERALRKIDYIAPHNFYGYKE